MSAHLTNEEMTDRLLGVPSMTVDAHLIECQACLAEFNVMRASIGNFRDAAHSWSENAVAVRRNLAVASRRTTWMAEWIVAAAFLLLMIVPVLYLRERKSPSATSSQKSPVAVSEQAQIEQDNELLSAVNSEITEGVPAPMQPLEVSFSNSSASSANQTK